MKRTKNIKRNPKIKMRTRARLIGSKSYSEFIDNHISLISRVMGVPKHMLVGETK